MLYKPDATLEQSTQQMTNSGARRIKRRQALSNANRKHDGYLWPDELFTSFSSVCHTTTNDPSLPVYFYNESRLATIVLV